MLKATIDVQKNGFLSSLQIVLHVLLQEHLTVVAMPSVQQQIMLILLKQLKMHEAMLYSSRDLCSRT